MYVLVSSNPMCREIEIITKFRVGNAERASVRGSLNVVKRMGKRNRSERMDEGMRVGICVWERDQ